MSISRIVFTRVATALVAPTTVLMAALISAPASSAMAGHAACRPTASTAAIRYCGPATATLSIFRGVTFRGGTCAVKGSGFPNLSLKLGSRSLKNPFQTGGTNSGLPYYDLSVSGPLSSPAGGGVVVFWKGRHWYGRGVSFRGDAHAGTFVAQGIPERGSHGTATGSYRC
jgi:hypothetical protein